MCDSYMKGRMAYYTTDFIHLDVLALEHEEPEAFKEGWLDALELKISEEEFTKFCEAL